MLSVHQRLKRVNIAQNAHNTIDKPCAKEKQGKGGRGEGERGVGVWGETVGEGGKSLILSDFLLPPSPKGSAPVTVCQHK